MSLDILSLDESSQIIIEKELTEMNSDQRVDFYGFTRQRLAEFLQERFDAPPYRATQLFQWVYRRRVTDVSQMSDLSQSFRNQIEGVFVFPELPFLKREVSCDGTRKYLISMEKGESVESVMIKQPTRMTLCVSSQVGCGMGCKFCRTATMGFQRHLKTSEILRQVLTVRDDAVHFDDMFSNIVFMGMGEPLHNFAGVEESIAILTDDFGLGMAPRRITVSTSGLVPAIRKFGERVKANLAVSLNATTNEVRSEIMPVNKAFPLEKLLKALREYPVQRRKRITIEYVMLGGVNDTAGDLDRLPKLLKGIQAKVNLIPYNENANLGFRAPSEQHVRDWQLALHRKGVEVTVRWSKGQDISAACGQLATSSQFLT